MATYREIKGIQIEVLSSDPSNPVEGQVWYNSTSNVVKGSIRSTAGAWSSGGNLNTARSSCGGSPAGTQNAALASGGQVPPAGAITELYNGSAWTEVADLNTARYDVGSAGTSTSNLVFGGEPPITGKTESWNGSSWTEVADLNETKQQVSGTGASNTSALAIGGYAPAGAKNSTEVWNGSSWTEVNNLNSAGRAIKGIGTQTSALAVGRDGNSPKGIVEQWDGTSWTEVADLNTSRASGATSGSTAAGLYFAGSVPPSTTATEEWNTGAAVTVTFDDS